MAIFMPIKGDSMIGPCNPPSSELERLQEKIKDMEPHANRVKKNMMDLQRGTMRDTAYPINPQRKEDELSEVISNMFAPAKNRPRSTPAVCRMGPPNFGADFSLRGRSREQWTTDMERTISQGLINLRGYDEHNRREKERYTKMLEEEKKVAMDLD